MNEELTHTTNLNSGHEMLPVLINSTISNRQQVYSYLDFGVVHMCCVWYIGGFLCIVGVNSVVGWCMLG